MHLVIFAHPAFLPFHSIHRFCKMLVAGMRHKGHLVEVWAPPAYFSCIPFGGAVKRCMGHIDQYVLFPGMTKKKVRQCHRDTLFVFSDNALGPWVPLVADRPHIIHCHDFLAQKSALGLIDQNQLGYGSRLLQFYINKGYQHGKYFMSVSRQTKDDLHRLLARKPVVSEVIYNGLSRKFTIQDPAVARKCLGDKLRVDLNAGYILHIGGNAWYKNRAGVVEIYDTWCSFTSVRLPLIMVGADPDPELRKTIDRSKYKSEIHCIKTMSDSEVDLAYAGASLLLFPSFAEGFGWPIAEAMACGCPVITTAERPMTEVGGTAAFYIPLKPAGATKVEGWAVNAARLVDAIVQMPAWEREEIKLSGLKNAARFNSDSVMEKIETVYKQVLEKHNCK